MHIYKDDRRTNLLSGFRLTMISLFSYMLLSNPEPIPFEVRIKNLFTIKQFLAGKSLKVYSLGAVGCYGIDKARCQSKYRT